jgi:hypothetical protein
MIPVRENSELVIIHLDIWINNDPCSNMWKAWYCEWTSHPAPVG